MANRSKEVQKLLRSARRQKLPDGRRAFTEKERTNGHVTLIHVETGGSHTIGPKASGSRSFENTRAELKRAGVKVPGTPPKPKKHGQPDTSDISQATTKDPSMANARPNPRVIADVSSTAVSKVLNDPYSAGLLHLALLDRAKQVDPDTGKPRGRRRTVKGRPGVEWQGDIVPLLHTIWDDLPKARNNPDLSKVYGGLVKALNQSGDLHLLRREGVSMVWWIADQDDTGQDDTGQQDGAKPEATANRAVPAVPASTPPQVSSPPAGQAPRVMFSHQPDQPPVSAVPSPRNPTGSRDEMKLITCPTEGCHYRDTEASVRLHMQRLEGQQHPDGKYPCREDGCHVVRSTVTGYKQHMRNAHDMTGHMCSEDDCFTWHESRAAWAAHVDREHAKSMPGRPARQSAVTASPAARPAVQQAPPGAPVDLEAVADGLGALLEDYRRLLRQDGAKDRQIERLRVERVELKKENKELRAKLSKFAELTSKLNL